MFKKILDHLYYQYEMMAQLIPIFAKLYIMVHRPSVIKEIEMSNLTKSDKIIQVGSGAIPYTLVIINKKLDIPVTGIDVKKEAVNKARYFIRNFNLENKINIEQGNGTRYDFSGYNFILISYGAKDTEKLLENVLRTSSENAKILFRKSTAENTDELEDILKKYRTKRKKMLLTQESILIYKNQKK